MNFPLTTIWERYILKKIFVMFSLCLFGFYALYVLINYSSHSSSFHHYHLSFRDIISYYLYNFITQVDILVPFAFLIACTHTLCSLNAHNELTALLMAGVTKKRVLAPFFFCALVLILFLYASAEFASPLAAQHYRQYEQLRASSKHSKRNHPYIQQIALADGSSVIFQNYNSLTKSFEDAYWIKSIDDIYRIGVLEPTNTAAIGTDIEHLKRDDAGNLVVAEKFTTKVLPDLVFNKKSLQETVTDPDGFALSALHEKGSGSEALNSEKDARLLTTYYRKLALPLACFLALLIPIPLCMQFTRVLPTFLIYATGILVLVAFFLVMNAASHLGERQVVSPALAIWVPCLAFLGARAYKVWGLA